MDAYKLMTIAAIGFFVFALDKNQKKFPAPIILIAAGMFLAVFPYFSSMELTKEFIFHWILPALLFTSAYQFPQDQLKRKAAIIVTLGTVCIAITAVMLGFALYAAGQLLVGVSLAGAMLISSLLIPTDPVTVVSILTQGNDKHHLAETIEGESLLNDGTSVVIFSLFSGYYFGSQSLHIGTFILDFFYTALGGAIVGLLISWFVAKGIHKITFHVYQVWLTILLAYGSFYIGEALGVSGVIATVVSGLLLAKELTNKEEEEEKELRRDLKNFWGIMEPFLLSIVFVFIGIESIDFIQMDGLLFVIIGFLLSVIVRGIVLLATIKSVKPWRKSYTNGDITLVTWGGIKGTMSLALLLSITGQSGGSDDGLLSWAFMMIMLSLIVQSLTFYPLKEKLGD
ncbi:cation:proton antiporter [Alteribacillus iranensis]|uniref:Sodium/proton antiporter, CPA1 family n=1 Tax=Alteribacillus iranensis TaxID=930128 RepID=A0A1I2FAZ1_9BACI|nr:sodium:proton antiporter [Alteribacillus iranensis]SFF02644.1 sodium/proton antiporter, CPA1 family [Alteribacillus iranensis]